MAKNIDDITEIIVDTLQTIANKKGSLNKETISKYLSENDEFKKVFQGTNEGWKEKYFTVAEELDNTKTESGKKDEIFQMLTTNLIILAKSDEAGEINDTLNEIKGIVNKELVVEELSRALDSLKALIFDEEPEAPRSVGKKKKGLFGFFGGDKDKAEGNACEVTLDIFLNIVIKLKEIVKGDLKKKVVGLEEQAKKARSTDDFRSLVEELSIVLGDYNNLLITEKREVEKSMQNLLNSVIETEKNLMKTLENQNRLFRENSAFNDAISNDINGISKSFSLGDTIDDIKNLVFSTIRGLSSRISKKRKSDEEYEKDFSLKLSFMQGKLDQIKNNATEIRNKSSIIEKESQRDPLTKLLNRRGYEPKLLAELERLRRYENPCSLAIFDLDKFKRINDDFGHTTGDKVLVKVAEVMLSNTRKIDILGRYGGEEFVVILPNLELEGAISLAEKIRKAIFGIRFLFQETELNVSLSGGVTEFMKDDTIESIYRRADDSLYRAKEDGRNRIKY